MRLQEELSFADSLGKTRVIDQIVYVTSHLEQTLEIMDRVFGYQEFEREESDNGKTAVFRLASGIELFLIQPSERDSAYHRYFDAYGKGIMGIRERIDLGIAGLWRNHIQKHSIPRIEENKNIWWMDLTRDLGCMYGLHICEEPIEKNDHSKHIGQICIAVANAEKSAQDLYRYLGLGPWEIGFINSRTSSYFYSSEYPKERFPDAEMRVGMNWFSNLEFELIEQVKGPMPYRRFLSRHGNGFHHIKEIIPAEKWEETLDGFAKNGVGVALAGQMGPVSFCNLDTEELLGCVYELGDDHVLDRLPDGYNAYMYPVQEGA